MSWWSPGPRDWWVHSATAKAHAASHPLFYSAEDIESWGPLHVAAKKGKLADVKSLLAEGFLPDLMSTTGEQTPLMWACYGGHLQVVAVLLAAGACRHVRSLLQDNSWNGLTPADPRRVPIQLLLKQASDSLPQDRAWWARWAAL